MRVRAVAGVLIAAAVASCSSAHSTAVPPASTSSSTGSTLPGLSTTTPGDPDEQPNAIPYNVGERVGLPNGWQMQVTRVRRPFAAAGLPALPPGREYVSIDLTMTNNGEAPVRVSTRAIATLREPAGSHEIVGGAAGSTKLDGTYAIGASRSGRVVFAVPVGSTPLQMFFDGPAIHTQRSVFQIDPPKVAPID